MCVGVAQGQQSTPSRTPVQPGVHPLRVENLLTSPVRLAFGPQGSAFVSDSRCGSVFKLDADFQPIQEWKGFDRPLGVAVAADGRIYVGSHGDGMVQVFHAKGAKLGELGAGAGEFQMPNDIEVAADGRIYVVDSEGNQVRVYKPDGTLDRVIGSAGSAAGQFKFPTALAFSADGLELYVGDQGNFRIQVFDPDGVFLREFGSTVNYGQFDGNFTRIQSLVVVDELAGRRVHVVDAVQNWVQVLDATGNYIETYGETGRVRGKLNLPLDIALNPEGKVVVSNHGNGRVEVLR